MKKVTLLVASVLCALGSYAQSSIEQLPTEIGKTTYQLVTPRGTLYYDKTIEESYLTSNCMTGRNENDVISLDDERGQFLVIPANSENNTFYLYSVEAGKFVNHVQNRAGLTDEPTEIAMWAHGVTESGSQAYNHTSFSYADYPFTIADSYVEGVRLQDNPHLNSINVCCWDGQNPDYRWCDTSHLDDGNAFKFVVAGEVDQDTYNEVRVALGLDPEVAPVVPEYNTTTKYFTAPELRAEADATGKALIAINNVTTTGNKYINGLQTGDKVSEDGTLAGARAPYESEVLEMIPVDGGYILRQAAAEEGEGYLGLSGNNFSITVAGDATVWTVLGPDEEGYGSVSGFDDLYTDIDHSLNENMVRFIVNGNQYMNGQGYGNLGGVRGGTGAWSFNYIYNANYTEGGEVVDPEPPVVEGPQAAFTLTNLSSTATDYSFPIEVPAEFAAPVLEAKATTTVIEFVKTAGVKAAFVASTDGGNNFYANITLADNRIGFDYMMDNGAEGWFTKTQAPYTNLDTTVRVALTQDEESGLLNWYDAETGQQINSTNVGNNSAWGARSFGSKGYSHLYVGGYLDAAGNAQYVFPGEIASVRVYPQLLTTEEMTSLTWEGLEDSFDYIPETPVEPEPVFDYAKEVAPVLAEANAALEGHDNVWVTTVGDKLITKASQFSSPFSQNDLGKADGQNLSDGCLIDNNNNTFWHSVWSQGNKAAHSHYLQVELDEAIDGDVLLTFVRRNAANDQVTLFDVEASMDGENFAHAAYIDMPNSGAGKTEQKTFALEEKAKFLRFWADATTNNRGYWHCAEFQLQTVSTDLNVDAPDYAYPTAVAALQEAIAATPATGGTKEDVEALAAAVEAYKAALAGYPEFTEWTGELAINVGEVKSIDDLLKVDVVFDRALSVEDSGFGALAGLFDETGDCYALVFDPICGSAEVEAVKDDTQVAQVAHLQFEKISDLTEGLQTSAKAAAAKIGGFQPAQGTATLLIASKSFCVDGEKYNEFKKATYEFATGTVTAIETIVVPATVNLFDLQGRRVNGNANGVMIQNGKKVLR